MVTTKQLHVVTRLISGTALFGQKYWVSGLGLSYEILSTRKHEVSETGSLSFLHLGERDTYSVGSVRKS
jgi:hypothetical protein